MFLSLYLAVAGVPAETVYPVVVRFGSVCCGIDRETHDRIRALIADHKQQAGKPLTVNTVYWGKEGEFKVVAWIEI